MQVQKQHIPLHMYFLIYIFCVILIYALSMTQFLILFPKFSHIEFSSNFSGGWAVSWYAGPPPGGAPLPLWLLPAAEEDQVPQTAPRCSHTRRRSRVQRCPVAQPNHAGHIYGERDGCLPGHLWNSWTFFKMEKGVEDSVLQAPTMASLAKEGVVLEQNYVQPKCAPSRAALMTGDPEDPSHLILSSRNHILT